MTPAHLHLILNHFPIVGTALGMVILALALVRRADRGIWLAGTVLLAISAGAAGAANLTGEPAEEQMEDMQGVNEDAIGVHEDRADIATVYAVLLGLGAVAGYVIGGKREGRMGLVVTLAASVVGSGLMAWTGAAGGEIRHPEVLTTTATGSAAKPNERGENGARGERGERGEENEANEH